MAKIISSNNDCSDEAKALTQKMQDKDDKIGELFDRLVEDTNDLEDSSLSLAKKNDIVTNAVFILARLRFIIVNETRTVDYAIGKIENDSTIPIYIKGMFSKRKSYLTNLNMKLNDIREDLSLIEKTFYYNNRY